MTEDMTTQWNGWRIARWSAVAALLLLPLGMMQIVPDWNWGPGAFILAGIVIGSPVLLYEVAARKSASTAYGLGAAIALATAFATIWTTIVRDDGNGLGFFGAVFTAAACTFAVKGRAEGGGHAEAPAKRSIDGGVAGGMARAMLATAGVQALLAAMVATAPITAEPGRVLVLSGVFCGLWLASAALFQRSVAAERSEATVSNR